MKKICLTVLFAVILMGCTSSEPPKVVDEKPKPFEGIPFKLKGKDYTLPVPYQTLLADGWEPEQVELIIDQTLNANSFTEGITLRNGRNVIWVSLYNDKDSEQPLDQTLIATISAENRESYYDDPTDIQVFQGLSFEQPKEAWDKQLGEAKLSENARFKNYIYTHSNRATTTIKFSLDEKRMEYIEIDNKTKQH